MARTHTQKTETHTSWATRGEKNRQRGRSEDTGKDHVGQIVAQPEKQRFLLLSLLGHAH